MNFGSKSKILPTYSLFVLALLVSASSGQEWSAVAIPAAAGSGMQWTLNSDLSDEFNSNTIGTVASELQQQSSILDWGIAPGHDSSKKWVNSKPDGWLGPGATYFNQTNYEVQNSVLKISATKVPVAQQIANTLEPGFTRSVYTSYITSKAKLTPGSFTEAYVRTTSTPISSDFWMLSDSNETEIDVLEMYNDQQGPGTWFDHRPASNVHIFKRGGDGGNNNTDQVHHVHAQSLAGQWKRWGVDWKSATELDFYIDGQLVRELNLATGHNVVYNENGDVVTSANCDPLTSETCMGTEGYNWDATGQYLNEGMRLVFDLEAASFRGANGIPTDAELADSNINNMQVGWVRTYQRVSAVPEPCSAGLLIPLAILALNRRKRLPRNISLS